MLTTIHQYLFMGVTTLFLFQSLILFIRSRNNRVRKTMAILELMWGLVYAMTLLLMTTIIEAEEYALLREKVLVVGSFYITFTHFFPIQILLPGWLSWKKMFLLTLPIILTTVIYYGGMYLLHETPEHLFTYANMWESIGHFNVWFRFVMLLSNFIYIILILKWLYRFEKKYIQWKNENFSDQEYLDISWMRSYDYIIIGIFSFYLGVLFLGGRISVICHCSFVIISFSYLFYKCLFYESPYPEDFFAPKQHKNGREKSIPEIYVTPQHEETEGLNDQTFGNKLQSYVDTVKQWLEEEKPFLYNDFKLTDVARVLPLNRSYLSRVFNEGFGQNFSEVIRNYRINYSKQILVKNPDLPMYKVASLSGFRSDSTYVKAFRQIMKMTPSQYRTTAEKER